MLEDHGHAAVARRQLVDAAAVEQDLAGVGALESGDNAQKRRLARAGRAEEGNELAGGESQRHVVEDQRIAIGLANAAQLQGQTRSPLRIAM